MDSPFDESEDISLIEFIQHYPDEQSAIDFFEEERWPESAVCPHCDSPRTRQSHNPAEKQLNTRPQSPPFGRHDMTDSARDKQEVYGPGFIKAKRDAMARSGGKCQFCGLRKAEEGHHWACPDYPSDEDIKGDDLTVLCNTCHELATLLRNWARRKADFEKIREEIRTSNSFYEKRRAFSFWFFPEGKGFAKTKAQPEFEYVPIGQRTLQEGCVYLYSGINVTGGLCDLRAQLHALEESRKAIKRQIEHLGQGRQVNSPQGLKNATVIRKWTGLPLDANLRQLKAEYAALRWQMNETITQMKKLES